MAVYPPEAIGGTLLSLGPALTFLRRRGATRRTAAVPLAAAAFLSAAGLLVTTKAAPFMLRVRRLGNDRRALQEAFDGFHRWSALRGACQVLFAANLWSLAALGAPNGKRLFLRSRDRRERTETMQKITPFLWFDHQAEEAARFYTSLFAGSEIKAITHYGPEGPGPKGSVMTVAFHLEGQEFVALNGGPQFNFTPAISFVVNCETQEEIDRLWDKLSEGGKPNQCGWLQDRYGVSWQIVPTILSKYLSDKDPEKARRVMKAMLQMNKMDIPELERAHRQK
jgi:predicted 3-demethylubiquinone-9 3-methyltransferase (glyoxalase superfamily)